MPTFPLFRLSLMSGACTVSLVYAGGAALAAPAGGPELTAPAGGPELTAPAGGPKIAAPAGGSGATAQASETDAAVREAQSEEAQAEADRADDDTDFGSGTGTIGENEIIVRGGRLRGALIVEQAPLLELDAEDIAAEGVASIAELVQQIQNQTGSARGRGGGRPAILIEGIRVGSFRELFSYPPEALERVEVYPEEVAQRFGFPPDRRVINLILKENYASREVELEFEGPSRGGNYTREQEFGYLTIRDAGRFNVNLTAQDTSLLTEDERDIRQTPGSTSELADDPAQAPFRSLIADTRSLEANVSWARAFKSSGISVSTNANYERADSRSLDGLNLVTLTSDPDDPEAAIRRTFGENDPLERRTASDTGAFAASLSAPAGAFRLTSTLDASVNETTTEIDNRFDTRSLEEAALAGELALDGPLPDSAEAGFETAFARRWNAVNLNTLEGELADLPAGELQATFDLGYDWNRIESLDTRSDLPVQLTRGSIQTGANLVIPLTSRRRGVADALGSITLNLQAGLEELSDFGTLGDYSASLNWGPFENLDLTATYIYREVAPGLPALGNPQVVNLNVPVFDFVTGENVLVDVTTGGNEALPAETQRDLKFAANWQLPFIDNTRFTIEYIRNRSEDVTSAFPQVTQAIEAAFPDRITRDDAGRLIALDRRAVSFAETRADRLEMRLSTRGNFGRGEDRRGGDGARGSGRRGSDRSSGGGSDRSDTGRSGREAFAALSERICADDGLELLRRIVAAARAGEDLTAIAPDLPPALIDRIVSRIPAGEEGPSEADLAAARERLCSIDPQAFASRESERGAQFAALGDQVCDDGGIERLRRLADALARDEDISGLVPGVDAAMIARAFDRLRLDDGTIPDEALERFRSRICSAGQQGSDDASQQSRGGGGGAGFNPLGGGERRGFFYFANLTHTIELANEILIAPGIPVLDQLDGDATGAFGLARNSTRLEAGMFGEGIGVRLSGRYTGTARLDGSGLPGSSDLFFGDLATFDLRVFTNIGELGISQSPALDDLRVSFRVDNIFDAQRSVRDANGDTPINYQPFVIDPVGRFIGVDIRKLF